MLLRPANICTFSITFSTFSIAISQSTPTTTFEKENKKKIKRIKRVALIRLSKLGMSIYGERRPVYARRFQNDLLELFSHNFNCSSSNLTVTMGESDNVAHIIIHICVFEGPYRNGHFSFYFNIPDDYPFKPVEIYARHPIYHPNIDIHTGKVAYLPVDWTPVLKLNFIALAVQMMMLQPSTDNILNAEASSYYTTLTSFEHVVQTTLAGGRYQGVEFPSVLSKEYDEVPCIYCKPRSNPSHNPNYMDVDTSQAPRSKAALVEVPISRQINNNFDILNSNGYVKSTSNRKRQHEDVDWDIVIQGMTTDAMVISQSQDWMKPNENIEPEKGLATDKKKRFRGDSGEMQTELYNDEGNMNM